jgi:hypothetical protein
MAKHKQVKCERCGRMAHSGKHSWWVENAIWKWVGLLDSTVLCRDCFEQDVCNKLGTPASGSGLWVTLTIAALAGLIPLTSDPVTFGDIGPANLTNGLTAAIGLEMWTTETFVLGIDGRESKAVRYGPLHREGDRLVLRAPEKSDAA